MRRARLALLVLGLWLTAYGQTESPVLELGKPRLYKTATGRPQEHYVLLKAGQYARLPIAQHTVNVAVTVFDPAGKQLFTVDNGPIGDTEDVEFIVAASGRYRLRVTASEPHAPTGAYEITLV